MYSLFLQMKMIHTSLMILVVSAISGFPMMESRIQRNLGSTNNESNMGTEYLAVNCRKHKAVLTDFGAVGDGKTSNTKAFREAIKNLTAKVADGGVQLIVPPGKWLTGSFNLTNHFTLFIEKGATILASQVKSSLYRNVLIKERLITHFEISNWCKNIIYGFILILTNRMNLNILCFRLCRHTEMQGLLV